MHHTASTGTPAIPAAIPTAIPTGTTTGTTAAIPTATPTSAPTSAPAAALPSARDVAELYRLVRHDGPAAHADALAKLARTASRLGADPPLVDLLTDGAAPDAVRIRAVARLASQWPALTEAATVADPWFTRSLAALLARWNAHHDLRASGATVAELATSRRELEVARHEHIATRPPLRTAG